MRKVEVSENRGRLPSNPFLAMELFSGRVVAVPQLGTDPAVTGAMQSKRILDEYEVDIRSGAESSRGHMGDSA